MELSQPKKLVTVVMRSKNSAHEIGAALDSLLEQRGVEFEVIVVDSGSTDGTVELLSRYPVLILQIPAADYVPGPVLNRVIAGCDSDIVVFQNSDVVIESSDALAALVAPFREQGIAATFARQRPRADAKPWVRRDYERAFPASGPAPDWIALSLPFAAMRRETWSVRPFYDGAWGSEDTEWGVWARSQGLRIAYVPEATVVHSHNYTLRQLYGRRFIEGEADAFIYGSDGTLRSIPRRMLASWANDFVFHCREREWAELLRIPALRFVYHWAYARGRRFGESRRLASDFDVTVGQGVVLSRR